MGKLTVNGFDALSDDLASLASLPDSVIEQILFAEAEIVEAEQRATAKEMGVYDSGMTAGSIKKGKIKKTASGQSITVAPRGRNVRGDRNSEVAFVNEYGRKGKGGSKGLPARPFIRTANARAEKKAVEAGEKVLNDYLDSKNL